MVEAGSGGGGEGHASVKKVAFVRSSVARVAAMEEEDGMGGVFQKSFGEKRFAAAPAIGRPVNEFSPPKGSLSIQAR